MRPCRIAITFSSLNTLNGSVATETRALVELIPRTFVGEVTSDSPAIGLHTDAKITWTYDEVTSDRSFASYRPTGTIDMTIIVAPHCTNTVTSTTIDSGAELVVDVRDEPPTYSAYGPGNAVISVTNCTVGIGGTIPDLSFAWMPNVANESTVSNGTELMGSIGDFVWDFTAGS